MLDRHAVQELLRAGLTPRAVAKQFQVSRRTVERIAKEAPITSDIVPCVIGRPRVEPEIRTQVATWLTENPELPAGEVWRLLREARTPLGLSTTYRLLASVRASLPQEVLVRFEGVAGEFAQFDFAKSKSD